MSDFKGNNDPLNLYDEKKGEISNNLKEPKENENIKHWSDIPIDLSAEMTIKPGKSIPLVGDWHEMAHEREIYELHNRPKIL